MTHHSAAHIRLFPLLSSVLMHLTSSPTRNTLLHCMHYSEDYTCPIKIVLGNNVNRSFFLKYVYNLIILTRLKHFLRKTNCTFKDIHSWTKGLRQSTLGKIFTSNSLIEEEWWTLTEVWTLSRLSYFITSRCWGKAGLGVADILIWKTIVNRREICRRVL